MKHVLIVGGGFVGLNAAKRLGKSGKVGVTLIDRTNHHLFQPLLYQVAMAGLSSTDIAAPLRTIFSKYKNVNVLQAEALSIHPEEKKAETSFGTIHYDYLVLGCGARHTYFGNEAWEPMAPGLKTVEQATEIRRRVLTAFEKAEGSTDREEKMKLLTFVVIGGGATGVELAGAIGELSRYSFAKDFKNIDPSLCRVILVEGGDRVLASYHPELSAKAVRSLESLGVQVWTAKKITNIDCDGVDVGRERIQTVNVIWAAGVHASSLNRDLGLKLDSMGRVPVRPDLSIEGHPEIFVGGDQASFIPEGEGKGPLPCVAPVALQHGRHIAKNILLDVAGKPRKEFRYVDKGQMATIGRSRAIVEIRKLRFSGFFAWLTWLFIHIYFLAGFKNRLIVLMQWVSSYFTFSKGARIILERDWQFYGDEMGAEEKVCKEIPERKQDDSES